MKIVKPTTIYAEAEAYALDAYERRIASLKVIQPLLAQLDALRPALKAKGCELFHSMCEFDRYQPNGYSGKAYKVVRIKTGGFWSSEESKISARWLRAFADLGFITVHHEGCHVILRKGHLLIKVDAPQAPGADTVAAAGYQGYKAREGAPATYAEGTPEHAAFTQRLGALA